MPKLRKMRTIKQIISEIKNDDPDSCITKYMLKTLVEQNNIYKVNVGNKILYDMDQVVELLGLI